MATIAEIRQKFPQYNDLSDQQLADAMYAKFYSDMPRDQFNQKIGLSADTPPAGAKPGSREYADWALQQARAGKKLPQISKVIESDAGKYNDLGGKAVALSGSMIEGVPIAGPTLMDMASKGRAFFQGITPEEARAQYEQAKRDNPITAGVGSVAGGVLPLTAIGTLPLAGTALGMSGSLPVQMGMGALSGAGIAGADTIARGGSMNDAVGNAVLGGGIGLAAPVVGAGLSRLFGNSTPKSTQMLGRALRDDNIAPGDIANRLAASGPDTMLMDLGPNLQAQAGALAATPGRAQTTVRDAVAARSEAKARTSRVQGDVAATIGNGPDIDMLKQNLVKAQSRAATPLYDAIRNVPVPLKGNFLFVFQTPMGKRALAKAMESAANRGMPIPSNGLTAGLIDSAKRVLDDIAGSAFRNGEKNLGSEAADLARILRTEADKVVPGYKDAREAFAGPAAVIEAVDNGAAAFSRDIAPAQLDRSLKSMTASERDAYLQGAQAWVESQMGTAVNDVASLRNMFRKGWNEQKLRILLGDDIANDLLRRIDRELVYGQTANAVTGNSESARRIGAMGEVNPQAPNVSQMSMFGAILEAFNRARRGVQGALQSKANEKLARGLTMTSGTMEPSLAESLQRYAAGRGRPVLAPAGLSAIASDPNKKEPLMITVRGGRPTR